MILVDPADLIADVQAMRALQRAYALDPLAAQCLGQRANLVAAELLVDRLCRMLVEGDAVIQCASKQPTT